MLLQEIITAYENSEELFIHLTRGELWGLFSLVISYAVMRHVHVGATRLQ